MLMLRWQLAGRLALLACVPLLPALSIVVVPSGTGAVRVSQLSGTLPGTLYPGTHFVMPLVHRVELFNIRDQLFATNPTDVTKDRVPVLKVYSREGLPLGLGISVRYQLDPQRLAYIENNLPRPIESRIHAARRRECVQTDDIRLSRAQTSFRRNARRSAGWRPTPSRGAWRPTASS